jgi:uncharacterized repeat protein (TIGR01451 family)
MRKRSSRATLASGLVAAAAVLTLVIAGVATGYDSGRATRVQEGVADNPRCPDGTAGAGSIKIDGSQLAVGDYEGRIRITARDANPDRISWELIDHSVQVMAVIVKGGDLANVYYYDGSVTSDYGLNPPLNNGGQAPQISHVEFCFDPKEGETPHLTVEKSASGTSQIQHSWSIDKQVKIAGASDATYGDNASLSLPDGGNGSFTWKVTVTHLQVQTYAVTGTITVSNDGDAAVSGVDVTDSLSGAVIDCGGKGSTNLTVPPGQGSLQCSYSVAPGSEVPNNTATASWGTGSTATDTADITWAQTEVGVPAAVKDDGQIDESLGLGDLTNNAWTTTYDERWTCSKGTPSPNGGRTNTATVTWEGGSDSDSASVQVGCGTTPPPPTDVCPNIESNQATVPAGMVKDGQGNCVTPPPPPPPTVKTDEFMDVQVVKDATPQVQLANGQADLAYTVRVRNAGPNQAHNVQLVDSAPSGVTFTGITQAPVGGGCSLSGGVLLQCSLGTLGPGVERVIGLSARVTQTGTYVNCATGTGDGKDTNGANNRACASTLVTAPVTPPTTTPKPPVTKPKPKPRVNICRVLKVTPSMVKANGEQQFVLAKVTRSRNAVAGVAVRFTGTGLAKVVKTNRQGIARLSLTPSKAGIMLVKITSAKACNSARIGVVGVFEPPVTG